MNKSLKKRERERKCKKQKAPKPKHLGNPGHNEKTKPKDYRYRRDYRFPS